MMEAANPHPQLYRAGTETPGLGLELRSVPSRLKLHGLQLEVVSGPASLLGAAGGSRRA